MIIHSPKQGSGTWQKKGSGALGRDARRASGVSAELSTPNKKRVGSTIMPKSGGRPVSGSKTMPKSARKTGSGSVILPKSHSGTATGGSAGRAGVRPAAGNGSSPSSAKQSFREPWKWMVVSLLIGIAGILYLTHVFQTQHKLEEVQQLRIEHQRAERVYTEVRRNYDRMTGPAEVYSRAQSLGMISGGASDPVILIED